MLCHSVRSCHSPDLSLYRSLVARLNLATGTPLGVYLTSGSLPRFPTRITLLTLFAMRDRFRKDFVRQYNRETGFVKVGLSSSRLRTWSLSGPADWRDLDPFWEFCRLCFGPTMTQLGTQIRVRKGCFSGVQSSNVILRWLPFSTQPRVSFTIASRIEAY